MRRTFFTSRLRTMKLSPARCGVLALCGLLALWGLFGLGGSTDVCGLTGMCGLSVAQAADKPAIKLQPSVDYAAAGISMAVPEGFALQTTGEQFEIARAVLLEGDKPLQAITLSAYPVKETTTPNDFADAMTAEIKKNLAISQLEIRKQVALPLAGLTGQARVMGYRFRGVDSVAMRVFAIRDVKVEAPTTASMPASASAPAAPGVRLCYVLTVESEQPVEEKRHDLAAVFAETLKSIHLTDVRRPTSLELRELGKAMTDYKQGYSIRPPMQWFASMTGATCDMGQTDFTMGGVPNPLARMAAIDVTMGNPSEWVNLTEAQKAEKAAQMFSSQSLEEMKKNAAAANLELSIVGEGPAKMAGVDGYQMVISQKPAAASPAANSAMVVFVQRSVYRTSAARMYALRLYCQCDPAKAQEIADKLAGGVEFLALATAPASGSTTEATSMPAATSGAAPAASPAPSGGLRTTGSQ